jgi:very-short-patch-repair endonuclease
MPTSAISRETREKARDLRHYPTKAERSLWAELRRLRGRGMRFRREAPIGPYIADFAWLSGRVVVEIDGDQHELDERKRHDNVRDTYLRARGFRILRFSSRDVLEDPAAIAHAIRNEVARDV